MLKRSLNKRIPILASFGLMVTLATHAAASEDSTGRDIKPYAERAQAMLSAVGNLDDAKAMCRFTSPENAPEAMIAEGQASEVDNANVPADALADPACLSRCYQEAESCNNRCRSSGVGETVVRCLEGCSNRLSACLPRC